MATAILPRRAIEQVTAALDDTRVVVINGARQVGKSTLAQLVLRDHPGGLAQFLDDASTRRSAKEDPTAFVHREDLLLIDEIQRVPDLWLSIKHEVDRDPRPGRFLLTGSARLLSLTALPDALIGRSETVELWPLSQGEIDGDPDGFVDAIFAEPSAGIGAATSTLRRGDYLARVARGGYPEAVRRDSPARRRRFFESYVSDLIVRDIQQVARITQITEVRQLLTLLAGQAGGILRIEHLANELAINAKTVRHYLSILETVFIVRPIPGWTGRVASRAVARPKYIFVDSGLAAYLTGTLVDTSSTAIGGLLEGFVVSELARQLTWSQVQAQLFHFRDRDGNEVDALIESYDGRVAGVEVKASETVRPDDFNGLRLLQRRCGDRFVGGYVVYCGEQSRSFGKGLFAVPIDTVWRTGQ